MPTTGREAADNIAAVLRAGRAGLPRDLNEVGVSMLNDMTLTLSKPGRGNLYTTRFFTRRGVTRPWGTRVPHRASAPGDPPAPDTGRLRASYTFSTARTPVGADMVFGTGDEKAKLLEYGTSKMAPRPHLRPVVARAHAVIRRFIARGGENRERAQSARR